MPSSIWTSDAKSQLFRPVEKSGLGWNYFPFIMKEAILNETEMGDKEAFIKKWFSPEIVR